MGYDEDTEELYSGISTDLTDALLEEYPWLEKEDFINLQEIIDFELEDVFSLSTLKNKAVTLYDKIIKNVGREKMDFFFCMFLLALNYYILETKAGNHTPAYIVSYKKDLLDKFWEERTADIKPYVSNVKTRMLHS